MGTFSERMGITQPKSIQIQRLDEDLRNSLWNVCLEYWFTPYAEVLADDDMYPLAVALQRDFYKKPIDKLTYYSRDFADQHLDFFQSGLWYMVLNLVEFLNYQFPTGSIQQQDLVKKVNNVLEFEKSAYRFISGKLAPITNEVEMLELEHAAQHMGRFRAVSEHIETALGLYTKKPNPDYRNSIKESISAVEAAVRIISGDSNATLGDALKIIDATKPVHGAFKHALLKLYGYTSDEGGIRHSLLESPNIDESDARFMLVACSAFVNYFISRS